ncbi:MAG: pirin family protein [Pseudomonadota bacterium]
MTTTPLTAESDLATRIIPRARDLGGFSVRRALPSPQRQMVGPFIFFDQMGPAEFAPGQGIDVRPHPHIGLATVTYLFDGKIRHRDSLGVTQDIEPGAVNLMTAGRGIVHSERMPEDIADQPNSMFGLQTWMALPKDKEETDPAFDHYPSADLPALDGEGMSGRVVLGNVYGVTSPVKTATETLYADVHLEPGVQLPLPDNHEDRGLYVIEGSIALADRAIPPGQMLVFADGPAAVQAGPEGARVMLFGGAVADGPRRIWWNFVSSDPDMIEDAKAEWMKDDHGRFDLPPRDNGEFIPITNG